MPIRSTTTDPRLLQRLMPAIPSQAAEELAASSRSITYAPGEIVAGGTAAHAPGLVADGRLRLVVRATDGREATLRTMGRGGMFGLVTLFDAERALVTVERSIVAIDRATAIMHEAAALLRVAERYTEVSLHLARQLADSASSLTDTAGQFAFMTVRQRLAGHLLEIAVQSPDGPLLATATQQQLANSVGSVREVVARTLHDFRIDGLITVSRGRVVVVDREGLADVAFNAS